MHARLLSTVDQIPVCFVVVGVEHHAVVQVKICRLERLSSAFQVFGSSHDIADALSYASGDYARVLQLSEADPEVNVFANQVDELICDEKIDPNPRVGFEEPREELNEGALPQDDRNRHPQHPFWCLLSLCEDSLGFFQKSQRLLTLIKVFPSLQGKGYSSCCTPQQRHAER